MCENLLQLLKSCSADNKRKLSFFLQDLLDIEEGESSSDEIQLGEIFFDLTKEFTLNKVRELSKNERSKKDLINYQYNYGEITFKTIFKIMNKIKSIKPMGEKEIFYDLGSGSGKVLIAASLSYSFAKCKGIEFLQSLYDISIELKKQITQKIPTIEEKVSQIMNKEFKMPLIEIFNENFETMDWSDGTVIFVSSTCYTREMMIKIQQLCEKLTSGTILITLTRSIENFHNNWKMIERIDGESSWGPCSVFIHQKGL